MIVHQFSRASNLTIEESHNTLLVRCIEKVRIGITGSQPYTSIPPRHLEGDAVQADDALDVLAPSASWPRPSYTAFIVSNGAVPQGVQ